MNNNETNDKQNFAQKEAKGPVSSSRSAARSAGSGRTSFTVREITAVGICIALLSVCSKITIPTPAIQFTLQTFAVSFTAFFLGPKLGPLAQSLYLLLGLVGLPLFSQGGGFAYVFKPSFGYLLSFIPASFVMGYLQRRLGRGRKGLSFFGRCLAAGLAGLAVIYLLGTAYFYVLGQVYLGLGAKPLSWFIWGGALMFLPTDSLSIAVASLVAAQVRKIGAGLLLKV